MAARESLFPLGASVRLEDLDREPHPLLARLRVHEPVSWVPALGGWLVTRHDLALSVMRNPEEYTVDDPHFSTARVIGPSMLSLDGDQHGRHRTPFAPPFRPSAVRARFAGAVEALAIQLIDDLEPRRRAELRRSFAGPLAASIIAPALGLEQTEVASVLAWYDAIVAAVIEMSAGGGLSDDGRRAFASLSARLEEVIEAGAQPSLVTAVANGSTLTKAEIVSNAAVLLFGGIETTEDMISTAALFLLERPDQLPRLRRDPALLGAAIEESLRLEPAAAVIDRYATADVVLGGAEIGRGELVRVSIAAANRDPRVFVDPDLFELGRVNVRRHVAFAHGPHVCVGLHLARLEARTALAALISRLPGLRLDPDRPSSIRGLVFRKPAALHVLWG